ncbi:hypothetical protein [Lacrimispora amygdalina]|uniref:hypothetical protein n=1 Tax=Lacrimispora amygdalina TaxID=253257 RepID=UPI000BE36B0C|nr:hypothetical protein [Lacrimispora amygdalina]
MKVKEFIEEFISDEGHLDIYILPSLVTNSREFEQELFPNSSLNALGKYAWDKKEESLMKSVEKSKKRFSKSYLFDGYKLCGPDNYTAQDLLNAEIERIGCARLGLYIFIKEYHLKPFYQKE